MIIVLILLSVPHTLIEPKISTRKAAPTTPVVQKTAPKKVVQKVAVKPRIKTKTSRIKHLRALPKVVETTEKSLDVVATAYCACRRCCGKTNGITATGTHARLGTIAADPRLIPYGTRIYVPGYGEGRIEDCGGAIKHKRIDVFFPSHKQATAWGKRRVRITVFK